MSFLQTWILWGLPLALLPLIIHLVNRMRHRTVQWAAMRFLEKATRSSTRMAKLRQWLILLLRVLAVAALVLAIARPLFGGFFGLQFSGAPGTVVVVLDRSASMNAPAAGGGETCLQRVLRQAGQSAAALGGDTRLVLVDSVTLKPTQVPSAGMLAELPVAQASDTGANLPAAVGVALDYLADNQAGQAEIWIASDLQTTSWRPEDPAWGSLAARAKAQQTPPRFKLLAAPAGAAKDGALSAGTLTTQVAHGSDGRKWAHELSFTLRGVEGEQTLVLFDGTNRHPVKVSGSGRHRHRFETDALAPGLALDGYIELGADANPANNRAYFCINMPVAPRALVVGDATVRADRILALAATGDASAVASPVTFRADQLKGLGLLVWHAPAPEPVLRQAIDEFVASGGVLVLAPVAGGTWGDRLTFGAEESAKAETKEAGAADAPAWRAAQWERGEGPFADADSGLPLALDRLKVVRRVLFAFKGGSTSLALFNDGQPLAARQKSGAGAVVALATLPDSTWSNLGMGQIAVPMMRRLLTEGGVRLAACRYLDSGSDPALVWPAAGLSAADFKSLKAAGSDGLADPALHAGVYAAGPRLLCFNRPLDEDDAAVLAPDSAANVLGDVPIRTFEAGVGDAAISTEIWRVALVLMLLLLMAEAGFLVPPAQAKKTDIKKGFHP